VRVKARKIVWCDVTFAAMFGYEASELLGKPTRILYSSDAMHEEFGKTAFPVIERGEIFRTEFEQLRRDGSVGWFDVSVSVTARRRSEQTGAFIDISATRASRVALARGEARLRGLFAAMAEGVVIHGADGRVIDANPAAERILGLSLAQILGKESVDPLCRASRIDGGPYPGTEHPAQVSLRTGEPLRNQLMGVSAQGAGTRWISINSQPVFAADGSERIESVIATFVDVTEQRQDFERLRGLAQRIEAVHEREGGSVALALHEGVAQDLYAAKLALDQLKIEARGRAGVTTAWRMVSESIDTCLRTTRELADELRPSALAHLDVHESIAAYARLFATRSGLRVDVGTDGPLPPLEEAQRLAFFRAAQEALTNVALHASATSVLISLHADVHIVTMAISDDGLGIAPLADLRPGSLGLLRIRERFEAAGGSLQLASLEPNGTKLTVTLPVFCA
jgi:PAS domain S-box-containing protein